MTSLAHNTSNTGAAFDAFLVKAEELGRSRAEGGDAQIKFDLILLEGAHTGLLDLEANKHGIGISDGKLAGERYYKAQTGANVFDHKQPSQRKLISNVNKCIGVGMNGKWGAGQPISVVNDMLVLRTKLKEQSLPVEDAHNTLMRFLTELKRRDDLPTTQEIENIVLKKDPANLDAEDIFEKIKKLATGLRAGTIPHCPDQDTSAEIDRIIKNAERRLTQIAKARAQIEPATQLDGEEEPGEQLVDLNGMIYDVAPAEEVPSVIIPS